MSRAWTAWLLIAAALMFLSWRLHMASLGKLVVAVVVTVCVLSAVQTWRSKAS